MSQAGGSAMDSLIALIRVTRKDVVSTLKISLSNRPFVFDVSSDSYRD